MGKLKKFFDEKLMPALIKVGNQRHLVAIRNGLAITLSFIIVGSIFVILGNLPFDWWPDFIGSFAGPMDVVVQCTFGVLGLVSSLGIGYYLSKTYKLDPITGAVMALTAFLLTQITSEYKLDTSYFGAEGLFTAIIVSIFAVEVLNYFIKKNIVIKLPKGVPPAVGNSFMALTPAFVVMMTVWVIRVVLGIDINAVISAVFSPIVFSLNTLPGILVYSLLVTLLWSAGIHGDMALEGIVDPIFLQFIAVNTAAFAAHQPAPYVTASGFYSLFVNVGGTGATLSLVILMLGSRSKVYKSLGKVSFPSACFEINEPVIFGFPVVLNPTILIPFIIVPIVLTTSSYLLMQFDLIGKVVALVPWTMPPIIGPFLATGGDWRSAVWSFLEMIIAALIYYPFFKSQEKLQLQRELDEEIAIDAEVKVEQA